MLLAPDGATVRDVSPLKSAENKSRRVAHTVTVQKGILFHQEYTYVIF